MERCRQREESSYSARELSFNFTDTPSFGGRSEKLVQEGIEHFWTLFNGVQWIHWSFCHIIRAKFSFSCLPFCITSKASNGRVRPRCPYTKMSVHEALKSGVLRWEIIRCERIFQ